MSIEEAINILKNLKVKKIDGHEEITEALVLAIGALGCWGRFLDYMTTEGAEETDIDKLKAGLWNIVACDEVEE